MKNIKKDWSSFKSKDGILKYKDAGDYYYIWKNDEDVKWTCEIMKDGTSDQTDFDTNYKSDADKNNNLYKTHNDDGVQYVTHEIDYSKNGVKRISVDFSDKRTWWPNAISKTGQSLTDSGDQTTYTFTTQDVVIDHFNSQRSVSESRPLNVYVNGVLKVEWTDYEVNFRKLYTDINNLEVVFNSALSGSDVVTADYYEAVDSEYILTPDAGKVLKLQYVEMQITAGATLNDVVMFEPGVNYAATGNTDYYVPGKETKYYRAHDFLNSNTEVMVGKAFGELTKDFIILPEKYLTGYLIYPRGTAPIGNNSFNMLKCRLMNNRVITDAEIATATFYCTEESI